MVLKMLEAQLTVKAAVCQDHQVHREQLVNPEDLVDLVLQEHQDYQENLHLHRVNQPLLHHANLVHKVHPVLQDHQEHQEIQEMLEHQEGQD